MPVRPGIEAMTSGADWAHLVPLNLPRSVKASEEESERVVKRDRSLLVFISYTGEAGRGRHSGDTRQDH